MLFAPPEVKSLSQYSEFGSHLQNRHFLIMVAAAILLHVALIAIYSISPHEVPTIIQVRALNIKLNSGKAAGGNGQLEMPKTGSMPNPTSRDEADDEILNVRQNIIRAPEKTGREPGVDKQKQMLAILSEEDKDTDITSTQHHVFQKPKKYIRPGESAVAIFDKSGKGKGNGSSLKGSKEGEEIIRNYEQEISLWMAQHKTYPEEARQQLIEGNAVVRIRINRNGHIIYSSIDTSSGDALIDQAVISMVHNSDPVPHVPENYPEGNEMEFLIPVSFRLK